MSLLMLRTTLFFVQCSVMQCDYYKFEQMGIKNKSYDVSKMISNFNFQEYLEKIYNAIPDIMTQPLHLFELALRSANMLIEFMIIFILVWQTVHILSAKEKKIINMRHLLVKWTFITIIYCLRQFAQTSVEYPAVLIFVYNIFAFVFAYPSKLIKNIYIKIFAMGQKKKNDDFIDNNVNQESSLYMRMMVSFTLFLLKLSKIIVTFIPIQKRKPIEESIKGLNLVIVEEKYFWDLYENTFNNKAKAISSELFNSNPLNSKSSLGLLKSMTPSQLKQSSMKTSVFVNKKNGLKESKLEAEAEEMILINYSSNATQTRKFSFYRTVKLIYYIESSELVLINDEDKRTQAHVLSELQMIEDDIIQFVVEDEEQPIYIKFKVKKDRDDFITGIHLENCPS